MTVKLVTVGRRSTVAAEAHVEVIKRQEDEVKAEAAPEDAAADINDELDIQLDEDVSSQLPKHATLNVAIVLHFVCSPCPVAAWEDVCYRLFCNEIMW